MVYKLNRKTKNWPVVFTLFMSFLMLSGCQTTKPSIQSTNTDYWFDEAFTSPRNIVTRADIYGLNSAMEAEIVRLSRQPQPREALLEMIMAEGGLRYDNSVTRTASETFNARAGNCMSLVVMTATLAKQLDIPYRYQLVKSPPVWDRQGGINLINGHVNIRIGHVSTSRSIQAALSGTVVDFLPGEQIRGYDTARLTEQQLLAMYYNNLAAEAMIDGEFDKAYQLLKASLAEDPGYGHALNTLGVLYRRKGLDEGAEIVYRRAMEINSSELNAAHNLAILLASQDRLIEWQQVHAKLELARIKSPYYHYDMGELAYESGEYRKAVQFYNRALDLVDYRHEFHFGLSKAHYQLGNYRLSERHLSRAESLAPLDDKPYYQLKLQGLQKSR